MPLRLQLSAAGYVVACCDSGEEALALLADRHCDLVVADLGSGGEALVQAVRSLPGEAPKVIALSGTDDVLATVAALKAGAADCLSKPVSFQVLRGAVEEVLGPVEQAGLEWGADGGSQVGRQVGSYQLVRRLGQGASSVVYLARPVSALPGDEDYYAVKMLKGDHGCAEDDLREQLERFLREAEVLSSLEHPNIVPVYEYGADDLDLTPYLAMRFVDGCPISAVATQYDVDVVAKTRILRQVADALRFIHGAGILHRDLKPLNILVPESLEPVLLDFGIAKTAAPTLTGVNVAVGTPSHMAPEYLCGGDATAASDLFSLGVVCYEVYTGALPFRGATFGEVADAIRESRPMRPDGLVAGFPPALSALVGGMLEKRPERRLSLEAVLEGMKRFVDGEPGLIADDHASVWRW